MISPDGFYFVLQSSFFVIWGNDSIMTVANRRLALILLAVPSLLLIPFIAMQFSSEVNWSLADFLIMGGLLLGVGLTIELVLRNVKKAPRRIWFILGIVALFLLVWAELAVGIFGSPFAGS